MAAPLDGITVIELGRAARINGARESNPTLPPLLGEPNDQILADFGFTPADIETMRSNHGSRA